MVFGLLNINKPIGPTSHDVVARVRRGIGERRVGHAGTLDPKADGVLVVALGHATRLVEYLAGSDKAYHARVTLGITTDSYDSEGEIIKRRSVPSDLTLEALDAVLDRFRGMIMQVPPAYSAVKVAGKAAYARVRAGQAVDLAPRPVTIHTLRVVCFTPPEIELDVGCSAGTYIRSLAHDLGEALGCGAMLAGLTRTASGHFRLEHSVAWNILNTALDRGTWPHLVIPPDEALPETPYVQLDIAEARRISNGMPLAAEGVVAGIGRAYGPQGQFMAVLHGDPDAGVWRPVKVFMDSNQVNP